MKETELVTSDLTSQEQLSTAPPSKKHCRFWGWALSPGGETVPHSLTPAFLPEPQRTPGLKGPKGQGSNFSLNLPAVCPQVRE